MRQIINDVANRATNVAAASPVAAALRRFAGVQRTLAFFCVTIPVWLIVLDTGPDRVRGSVSAYHDMVPPQAYYFPLTVAAMLFFWNGIVRAGRLYNVVLGIALSGVVLFNEDGATEIAHYVFAIGFFGLNVLVILWFCSSADRVLRFVLASVIVVAAVLWLVVDAFTTFWAEWVSLAAIATHFVLDGRGTLNYGSTSALNGITNDIASGDADDADIG